MSNKNQEQDQQQEEHQASVTLKTPELPMTNTQNQSNTFANVLQESASNEMEPNSKNVKNNFRTIQEILYGNVTEESSFNNLTIINKTMVKETIVIHSPDSEEILGTKIDAQFMLVTKHDLEKRIDPKYHETTDTSFINESINRGLIIPINQEIVYQPPIIEDDNEYHSECDDELLTSYTSKGHFLLINRK